MKSHLFDYELKYYQQGYKTIGGCDEAGRGPLAGPVVAAFVVFKEDVYLPQINDSKQLSKKKREALVEVIYKHAVSVSVGVVSADEIDEINIYQAARKAMLIAIDKASVQPDFILTDAMPLPHMKHEAIIKGDQKSVSIAAASIIAKTYRDALMEKIHQAHPDYDFLNNQGYGTKKHLKALETFGITPYHRKTFNPIKNMI